MSTQYTERFERAVNLIAVAARAISDAIFVQTASFNEITDFEWEGAEMWAYYCGTIPAFSFVVAYEDLKRGVGSPSREQQEYFQNIEDALFQAFSETRHIVAPVGHCLKLRNELAAFQQIYPVSAETVMPLHNYLGVVFPSRYLKYRRDWVEAILKSGAANVSQYPAMRVEADLRGILTPESMLGQKGVDLKLVSWPFICGALAEFGRRYAEEF